jgi:hypothetical protein
VESGGPSIGEVGECDMESRHLQYCSPRLCRLRTDGLAPREQVLNVPIACRRYGPDKPSSMSSIEGVFTPTTSIAILGEKLGTDLQIGQSVCYGLCRESFFSGAVTLSIAVVDFAKGCYVLTA